MKISGKFILKVAGTLTVISLVVALLLGLVNGVTNGGTEAGYVAKVAASGSQGTITMMVGIDANGAITGISVVSHSETSGIGTKVVENKPNAAGTPVLDQFIGMSGAGTLAVGSNITAISGATVSTKGITMGANAALAAVEALG